MVIEDDNVFEEEFEEDIFEEDDFGKKDSLTAESDVSQDLEDIKDLIGKLTLKLLGEEEKMQTSEGREVRSVAMSVLRNVDARLGVIEERMEGNI